MNYTGLNESINATFTALQAALAQQADEVLREIGCAAREGDFGRRDVLAANAKRLRTVEALVSQAVQTYSEFAHEQHTALPSPTEEADADVSPVGQKPRRSPPTRLVVLFNGQRFDDPIAVKTFIAVLSAIGFDQVHGLHLIECKHELVSRHPIPEEEQGDTEQKFVDGWWVVTTSSTERKKADLDEICERLGLCISVQVKPRYEPRLDIF